MSHYVYPPYVSDCIMRTIHPSGEVVLHTAKLSDLGVIRSGLDLRLVHRDNSEINFKAKTELELAALEFRLLSVLSGCVKEVIQIHMTSESEASLIHITKLVDLTYEHLRKKE